MKIDFSAHCIDRIKEREIDEELVKIAILKSDEMMQEGQFTVFHKQYKDEIKGKDYLLRVFVKKINEEIMIVESVYKTSKIQKYRR